MGHTQREWQANEGSERSAVATNGLSAGVVARALTMPRYRRVLGFYRMTGSLPSSPLLYISSY